MDTHEIEIRRRLLLAKLAEEDAASLRAVRALPADKLDWKPDHEKCMTAGRLAAHGVLAAHFFLLVASGQPVPTEEPPPPADKDELVASVEATMQAYRAHVEAASVEDLAREIDFFGQTYPAIEVLSWHPWHMVHHRGQLVLYLRMMGAHVPSTYGPSGDEDFAPPGA